MRRTSSFVAALSVATLLAGCLPGGSTVRSSSGADLPGLNDARGLDGEYRAELVRLEFPPGTSPPPKSSAEQPDAAYEAGLGTSSADFVWLCAWFAEYISQRAHDPARAAHALSVLDGFPSLDLWNRMDPAGRQTIVKAIADARVGNTTGITDQQDAMMCSR
jgi:hypothetical protein